MPFLTNLIAAAHDDGTWRLTQPLTYSSQRYGQTIEAPRNFVTDYASVPRLPVVFALTGDTGHRASVVHDWLYRHGAPQWSRQQADLIFRDALLEGGEPRWRAYSMWLGVRAFGRLAWYDA